MTDDELDLVETERLIEAIERRVEARKGAVAIAIHFPDKNLLHSWVDCTEAIDGAVEQMAEDLLRCVRMGDNSTMPEWRSILRDA